MRRVAVAGILLASCTLATAQEGPGRDGAADVSKSGNWFTRLWSFGDKPPDKRPPAGDKKKSEPASAVVSPPNRRDREEVILNRRNEVILKLREIALRTSDDALLHKADELQERAWDVYLQRTAGMQPTPAAPSNLPISQKELQANTLANRPHVGTVHSVEGNSPAEERR
jgi:hypothetical protein